MTRLAELLNHHMALRGWSQRELEKQSGVNRASIRNAIDEGGVPTLVNLEKLAKALNLPLWHLVEACGVDLGLSYTPDERTRRAAALMHAVPQYEQIINHLAQVAPDTLDGVLKYLELQLQLQRQ